MAERLAPQHYLGKRRSPRDRMQWRRLFHPLLSALVMLAVSSGCATNPDLVLQPGKTLGESVLFDTIKLDPNHRRIGHSTG